MVRIVISVVLLVLLAALVSLNLGFTTSIDLLGIRRMEKVSIVAVSALSFAFGIVYSLFIYFGSYRHGKAKRLLADKVRSVRERGKQLDIREAEKEKVVEAAIAGVKPQTAMPLN